MSKPQNPNKPYTQREADYIRRVAGRVPVQLIAETLNRTPSGIRQWACANGVKLKVPYSLMVTHWIDYLPKQKIATE